MDEQKLAELDRALGEDFGVKSITLSNQQSEAIELCLDTSVRVVGITGAAGTGKTTILKDAVDRFRELGTRASIAAPTGRASKRITEATGLDSQTIHKLLEFPQPHDPPKEGEKPIPGMPRRTRRRPLELDVLFIDEASMVGTLLYQQIIEAMPPGSIIRFFGDNNQLGPIDVEKDKIPPFVEILSKFPSVTLTHNYRSDDAIISNSQLILAGRIPQRNPRFHIIFTDSPMATAVDLADSEFGQTNHQIITPTRVGQHGSVALNAHLAMKLNKNEVKIYLDRLPDFKSKEPLPPLLVRLGDKIVWTKNDYVLGMLNGELGVIETLDPEDGNLTIATPDRLVSVPHSVSTYSNYHQSIIKYDPRRQIDLGYAVTTHKAQGSEFESVIIVLNRGQSWMLNRNNLYTAVTRAKKRVVIVCDQTALRWSMKNPKKW